MRRSVAALGRKFRDSRRGVAAVIIGLTLPVVIAMVGLGTEITFVLYKQRQMQLTADAAALGAATALQTGHPAFATEALGISGSLGYVNGTGGTTVTVNNPPTSGSQINNNAAVEVIISQPQTLSMISLFHTGAINAGGRAVAIEGSGSDCILQIGNNGADAFTMSNGAVANLTQCGLAVDFDEPGGAVDERRRDIEFPVRVGGRLEFDQQRRRDQPLERAPDFPAERTRPLCQRGDAVLFRLRQRQ